MSSDIDLLWKIYDTVKSWLEYAEKKNAVLFTIVGLEMGVLRFLGKEMNYKHLEVTLSILLIAFILALASFYPKTDRLFFLLKTQPHPTAEFLNLFYYNDIRKFNLESYITAIGKRYEIELKDKKLAEDICDQIIILSKIASSKFGLFKLAFYFAIIGQVSLLVLIILEFF